MIDQKAGKYACFEYERKFLLQQIPPSLCNSGEYKEIEDRYFPGTRLRLRTVMDSSGKVVDRKLTQKYVAEGSDLAKTVITNLYLSDAELAILQTIEGRTLKKRRYKFHQGEISFSIDRFYTPDSLIIAEIEFASEAEMRTFAIPFADWEDVSHREDLTGGALAVRYGLRA